MMRISLLGLMLFFAQGAFPQNFGGGFKAGVAGSEVSGDKLGGPGKFGIYAGVFTNFSTGAFSHLQLELMYIQKGSRSVPSDDNNFYSYKFFLHYVEIPLSYTFQFSTFELPYIGLMAAEAGLSWSFMVDHYEEELDRVLDLSQEKPFHDSELNLFLGLYYPLNDAWDVSLRFTQGITPLRAHQGQTTLWYNRGQYNSVWGLGLSFTFL
ncbi:MAG: outer membrane beta-barrel protein [Bacteroidales bacterium]